MLPAVPDQADYETPMIWRREFPGTDDQARAVRVFAATLLVTCPVLDDVLLVLDELVVNALLHTRSGLDGGRLTVEISRDAGGIAVSVADEGGPEVPCAGVPAVLAESGRGLLTVAALSTGWSWTGDERGRTLRATFAVP
ncbi:ATP-binding protein [Actinomadura rudentiformis]|uniref:ATP-binding protein n=1 Tax=Actinomadura rudentiformis TaxID=359158 RepID=A0A6H9YC26_9ACTN|nr:ATP-binding protein [Actinomadura rudentiformis]KAB2342632.1 ATP-binding protein [Actinomadura rudentiformis]